MELFHYPRAWFCAAADGGGALLNQKKILTLLQLDKVKWNEMILSLSCNKVIVGKFNFHTKGSRKFNKEMGITLEFYRALMAPCLQMIWYTDTRKLLGHNSESRKLESLLRLLPFAHASWSFKLALRFRRKKDLIRP